MEKAENFVRMHGAVSWGDGGEPHRRRVRA